MSSSEYDWLQEALDLADMHASLETATHHFAAAQAGDNSFGARTSALDDEETQSNSAQDERGFMSRGVETAKKAAVRAACRETTGSVVGIAVGGMSLASTASPPLAVGNAHLAKEAYKSVSKALSISNAALRWNSSSVANGLRTIARQQERMERLVCNTLSPSRMLRALGRVQRTLKKLESEVERQWSAASRSPEDLFVEQRLW